MSLGYISSALFSIAASTASATVSGTILAAESPYSYLHRPHLAAETKAFCALSSAQTPSASLKAAAFDAHSDPISGRATHDSIDNILTMQPAPLTFSTDENALHIVNVPT